MLTLFADTGVGQALQSLGTALTNAFVAPFAQAVQSAINSFVDGINGIIDKVNSVSGTLRLPTIPLIEGFQISIPGAALGAVGLKGMAMVGERGPELISTKRPATVFPNSIVKALEAIAQPQAMPMSLRGAGGASNVNNSRTFNATFNGGADDNMLLRLRQMEAFSRG